MKPVRIGLSPCIMHRDPERAIFKGKALLYMEESMAHYTLRGGAIPFLLPTWRGTSAQVENIIDMIDGLILQGGVDVSPTMYGETPVKEEWAGDLVRDEYEIALFREAMRQGKPVYGICRGAQLINVALGGSLYQDTFTQREGALLHRDWEIYDQLFHQTSVVANSKLADLLGGQLEVKTNSVHHQAVKDLAEGLNVEAICKDDGVIEAFRWSGEEWCFGVQWHPEFHDPTDRSVCDGNVLLEDFLVAVRQRSKSK